MKIFITGSRGYIGSYLCKHFKKGTIRVIRDNGPLSHLLKLPDCDVIIHAAGRKPHDGVSVSEFAYDNILATEHLRRIAEGKPIVYLSTMAVYTLKPYGLSKLMGEECLANYRGKKAILRLPRIVNEKVDSCQFLRHKDMFIAVNEMIGLEQLADFIETRCYEMRY